MGCRYTGSGYEDQSDAVPLLAVLATVALGFVSSRANAN